MGHHFSCASALVFVQLLSACGGEPPTRGQAKHAPLRADRRHDYASTWVYTVGEVDSPAQTDCTKAFGFIDGEADCVGKACQRAVTLIKDYEFACPKFSTAVERARLKTLSTTFTERTVQPMTACLEKVETWLDQGCGENGACENLAQRWATQCAQSTRSKLLTHLLERLIENSLQEPRRVRLDARSCDDFAKKVDESAVCSKPFDCEDALPKVDEYLLRCAQGKRRAISLRTALNIVKIRLGADKPVEPIALTDDVTDVPALAGTLPLVDKSGVVIKVCDEPATELKSYLEQRRNCKNGSVTLLRASAGPSGKELVLTLVPHDTDEQYQAAYPKLWVQGETEARTAAALAAFSDAMRALPEQAADDFAKALSKVSAAFSNLPASLRQSTQLRDAIAAHDSVLSPLFAIIASAKVSVAGTRLTDDELSAFLRRSETLVFADLSKSGNIELGAQVDLSELLTKEALPTAFAAYDQGLGKLRKQALKRKVDLTVNLSAARTQIAEQSRACTAARGKLTELQKQFEQCLTTKAACDREQREKLQSGLYAARTTWSEARVREIITKVSAAQPVAPSAVCNSL